MFKQIVEKKIRALIHWIKHSYEFSPQKQNQKTINKKKEKKKRKRQKAVFPVCTNCLKKLNLPLIIASQTGSEITVTQDQKVNVENNVYIGSGNKPDPPCMAQPGLQPCLSSGSYTGCIRRQLNGT